MWWLVAIVALILGALVSIKKKDNSFFFALVLVGLIGLGYYFLTLISLGKGG